MKCSINHLNMFVIVASAVPDASASIASSRDAIPTCYMAPLRLEGRTLGSLVTGQSHSVRHSRTFEDIHCRLIAPASVAARLRYGLRVPPLDHVPPVLRLRLGAT
eukprot:1186803-Prorocentrum_minimum.AAC.5